MTTPATMDVQTLLLVSSIGPPATILMFGLLSINKKKIELMSQRLKDVNSLHVSLIANVPTTICALMVHVLEQNIPAIIQVPLRFGLMAKDGLLPNLAIDVLELSAIQMISAHSIAQINFCVKMLLAEIKFAILPISTSFILMETRRHSLNIFLHQIDAHLFNV